MPFFPNLLPVIIEPMQSCLSSRFFLFFPLPLIGFQIATMFLSPGSLNFTAVDFIGETFFLGSTHVYLSLGIFLLPAAADWFQQRAEAKRQSIGVWTLALCILAFSFFMWRALSGGRPSSTRPIIILITDLMFIALLLHHTLWQVKGLSMIYRLQSAQSPEKPKWRVFENDHFPFYLLLSLVLCVPTASTAKALFPSLASDLNLRAIGLVTSVAMFIIAALLIVPDLLSGDSGFRKRAWFNLRISSWALIPVSKYGLIISSAIHGIEYLFVNLQIFSKENREFAIKMIVSLLAIAISVRICIWGFRSYSPGQAPLFLTVLSSAGLTLGLAHYYWDRKLFAMREPETRAFTGSRLIGSVSGPTSHENLQKPAKLIRRKNGGQRRD